MLENWREWRGASIIGVSWREVGVSWSDATIK
jgi:hypothetical protein